MTTQLPQNALIAQFLPQIGTSQVTGMGARRSRSAWHKYSTAAGGISHQAAGTQLVLRFGEIGNKRWNKQSSNVPICVHSKLAVTLGDIFFLIAFNGCAQGSLHKLPEQTAA